MVVAGSLAALLAFALPLAIVVKLLVEERVFGEAELRARVIAAVLDEVGDADVATDALDRVDDVDGGPGFTVVFADGRSHGPPLPATAADEARRAVAEDWDGDGDDDARLDHGDATLVVEGFTPRALPQTGGVVVVLVPNHLVTSDLDPWWWAIGLTAVVLFAVSATLANQLGLSIVRPVRALVSATGRLRGGDLAARVEPDGPPEIRELGYSFNLLGERIGQLIAREAERVSDLSHRLRTPLTALHLEVEGLHDHDEAARLSTQVRRMDDAVDAVIADAHARAEAVVPAATVASEVVTERVEFWRPLFDDQRRGLSLVDRTESSIAVGVAQVELGAALDELLANAIAHTSPGTDVRVEIGATPDGCVVVEVSDAGAGFADLAVVGRGVSGGGSTGLGLDIVRRTAEASGGRLELGASPEGGASVRMVLGPAMPSPRPPREPTVRRA